MYVSSQIPWKTFCLCPAFLETQDPSPAAHGSREALQMLPTCLSPAIAPGGEGQGQVVAQLHPSSGTRWTRGGLQRQPSVVLHLSDTYSAGEEKSPWQGVKGAEALPMSLGPHAQPPRQERCSWAGRGGLAVPRHGAGLGALLGSALLCSAAGAARAGRPHLGLSPRAVTQAQFKCDRLICI